MAHWGHIWDNPKTWKPKIWKGWREQGFPQSASKWGGGGGGGPDFEINTNNRVEHFNKAAFAL